MTNEELVWVHPQTGEEYHEGDVVPWVDLNGLRSFNETIVRVNDPGFAGIAVVRDGPHQIPMPGDAVDDPDAIVGWIVEPREAEEGVCAIGPASQVWRWDYARREASKALSMRLGSMVMGDDDPEDWC